MTLIYSVVLPIYYGTLKTFVLVSVLKKSLFFQLNNVLVGLPFKGRVIWNKVDCPFKGFSNLGSSPSLHGGYILFVNVFQGENHLIFIINYKLFSVLISWIKLGAMYNIFKKCSILDTEKSCKNVPTNLWIHGTNFKITLNDYNQKMSLNIFWKHMEKLMKHPPVLELNILIPYAMFIEHSVWIKLCYLYYIDL